MATTTLSQKCRHFVRQRCGGCAFLHTPYTAQLKAKQEHVADLLRAAFKDLPAPARAGIKNLVQPTVPSPNEMGHRASAKFCLHEDAGGRKAVGLYQQGSRVVIDTMDCPANVDLANQIAVRLFSDRNLLPAKFCNHQEPGFQKGRMKFATIRTSPAGGGGLRDAAVIISHTGVDKAAMVGWLNRAGLSELCVYESTLEKASGENIMGRTITHLSGPDSFPYVLDGEVFEISPISFFQANHGLAPALIEAATAFAADGDVLLDLYGGFGAYSFHARRRFREALVVDGNQAAIAAMTRHAERNRGAPMKGFATTCENFLQSLISRETAERVTHVIVNPSRTGLSADVRSHLTTSTFPALKTVHYVSCNPSTFARDASELVVGGLTLTTVQPFDMFPHADHVEVVGTFRGPA